jgi:hypothetical protein
MDNVKILIIEDQKELNKPLAEFVRIKRGQNHSDSQQK